MTIGDRIFVGGMFAASIVVPVLVVALHLAGYGATSIGTARRSVGGVALLFAVGIAFLNFYLSFVRCRVYLRRNGDLEEFRFVSGVPLAGSIAVLTAAVLLPANAIIGIALLVLLVIDTGGIHWASVAFIRELWGNTA